MDAKVSLVETAYYSDPISSLGQLMIRAQGQVASSGWKDGRLIPWIYVDRPSNGIIDFDFIASAPTDRVLWIVSPIEGIVTIQHQHWIKGFRVHSSSNNVEVSLSDNEHCVKSGNFWDAPENSKETTGGAKLKKLELDSLDDVIDQNVSHSGVFGPKDQAGH